MGSKQIICVKIEIISMIVVDGVVKREF